jgi:hypothetical protein
VIIIPIQECSEGDKKGFKWGNAGKCYLHDGSDKSIGQAKENAYLQGVAEGGGKLETNAQELTREYLLEFYNLVLSHPGIMKQITDEIHITARAKAGGQLHGQKEAGQTMPEMNSLHFNNAEFGGNVLYKDDQITIVPTAIMQERVTNGAMKLYDEFKDSVHWWKNKPIIPPHAQGDPPVNHKTKIAGKVLDAWLNPELKRIDGAALFYNARIAPNDLKRMWEGEKFGNSPGYYCNDEAFPGTWEGIEFKTTERGPYYPDHLSMVPRGACPLPHCGFNLDVNVDESKIASLIDGLKLNFEVTSMVDEPEKKGEPIKVNAEVKPEEKPVINVAAPTVNVDMSTVLTEMKAMREEFVALKTNIAEKDAKITALSTDLEVRTNAQKASDDALITATLSDMVLPAFKDKVPEYFPAFKANAALWIAQNRDKLDLVTYSATKISPTGQAFVPHVNASDEDEYANLGVMSVEALGKAVKGSA